jgi:hypothetical protein
MLSIQVSRKVAHSASAFVVLHIIPPAEPPPHIPVYLVKLLG